MTSQTATTLLTHHSSAPDIEGQVSQTGRKKSRCLNLLLRFMVIGIIGLLASAVFFLVLDRHNKTIATFEASICVPYAGLFKDTDGQTQTDRFIDQLTTRKENGVQLYCANDFEQLSELVRRVFRPAAPQNDLKEEASIISKTNAQKHSISSTRPKPVSAHKIFVNETANYLLKRKRLSTVVLNLNLTISDSHAEHAENVGVTSSTLDIQVAGFYYVYSHVAFVSKKSFTGCNSKNLAFSLMVRKNYYNYKKFPEKLDHGKATCRHFSTGRLVSGFVGGVFWLNVGDSVYVKMSRKAYRDIVYKKELSFLGLFLLSEEKLKMKED